MRIVVGVLRLGAAAGGLMAVVATLLDTASRTAINPFNFFGFFTIQSNIIFCLTMLVVGATALRARAQGETLDLVRACATTYIVLVGIVYNTLLTGLPGGVALPWANTLTHVVLPLYGLIDWVLFADRPPLPWRRLWIVLVFPLVWVVVVLLRGATDGWVPYPFLDPATGYPSVAVYCVAVFFVTLAAAAGTWAASRLRIVELTSPAESPRVGSTHEA